jgi:hypothetical protein
MSVAAKLSRKLHETLGDEAAEALVNWMDSVEQNRAELREVNDLAFARIDARFGEAEARREAFRHGIQGDLAAFRGEIQGDLAALRDEMHAGFARLEVAIERVNGRIDARYADLLKWSLTFWVGTTLAIGGTLAALVRFGR